MILKDQGEGGGGYPVLTSKHRAKMGKFSANSALSAVKSQAIAAKANGSLRLRVAILTTDN